MKTRRGPLLAMAVVVVAALALAGCDHGQHLTPIGHIADHPDHFDGQTVEIVGHVTRVHEVASGIINLAAYQVDDGTGTIWVLSRTGAPERDRQIGVKGTVHAEGRFGTESLGAVVEEHERRTR